MTATSLESTKDSAAAVSDRVVAAGPVRFFSQFTMSSASLPAAPQTNACSCETGYHPPYRAISSELCPVGSRQASPFLEQDALLQNTGLWIPEEATVVPVKEGVHTSGRQGLLTSRFSPVCLHFPNFLKCQSSFSSVSAPLLHTGLHPGDVVSQPQC